MAAIINDRDALLQAANPRLLPVVLPDSYVYNGDVRGNLINAGGSFNGNASGTFGGLSLPNIQNPNISLSGDGRLIGAGGGEIDNLDYSNVSGAKPPADANNTVNILERSATAIEVNSSQLFVISGAGSSELVIGSSGLFARNTSGQTTFSINGNNGETAYLGNITGGANIDIYGTARFGGATSQGGITYAATFNASGNSSRGIYVNGGVFGRSSSDEAVQGIATSPGGIGVNAIGSGGALAFSALGEIQLFGSISLSTQTISNLTAGSANHVNGENVSGAVSSATNASNATTANNALRLSNIVAHQFLTFMPTDSGNAGVNGHGIGLFVLLSGIRSRASGNSIFIESVSDARLKQDIAPENLGLSFIDLLKPVTYRMKNNPQRLCHGFIAQDIQKLHLHQDDVLFQAHDDGTLGTDYMAMIAPLVNAVQALSKQVKHLEGQLAIAQAHLNRLIY